MTTGDRSHPGDSRLREELGYLLELFVLCGFVIVQPLFEVTGESPDFFLFRQADRADIVWLTILVVVGPPLALAGAGALAGVFRSRARWIAHVAILAGLFGLLGIEIFKLAFGVRGAALAILASLIAAGLATLYVRWSTVRMWFRYAAPAPFVFAALFLFVSPVSDLVLPGGGGVAAVSADQARAPVVVVVLDELPLVALLDGEGEIDERLYPNFARLAETSTFHRNATTASANTLRAVPSLLTGQDPASDVAPSVTQYPENLFTLLGASHDVTAFEAVTALCPPDVCTDRSLTAPGRTGLRALVPDAADVWRRIVALGDADEDPVQAFLRDETVGDRAERTGDARDAAGERDAGDPSAALAEALEQNQPARFVEFVDSIGGGGRPFHYLHLLLPHSPFQYLPDGLRYNHDAPAFGKTADGKRGLEPYPFLVGRQRHMLQTVYVDGLLGDVLDRLEATGMMERSLVVVTADHGLRFVPGGRGSKQPDENDAHEVLWVPLFVKAPGQTAGEVRDDNAQLVDLVPTVAEVLGVEVPWETDGISLVSARRETTTQRFFYNSGEVREFDKTAHFADVLAGGTHRVGRPEEGPRGLYRAGPHPDLVGTRVDTHEIERVAGEEVVIDDRDDYRDVDPGDGVVPALVSGALPATPANGLDAVAVGVNGRIGGVSAVFPMPGRDRAFATMVGPDLFRDGENRIEVFLVERGGDSFVLHAMPVR